jgi:hypothetical protein
MYATIKGLRKVDYIKKDGTEVDTVTLYVEHTEKDVVGASCSEIYLSAQQQKNLGLAFPEKQFESFIGRECVIEYNSRGFLISLDVEQ